MDVGEMQAHCLAKPGAWADNPGNQAFSVVKVAPDHVGPGPGASQVQTAPVAGPQ